MAEKKINAATGTFNAEGIEPSNNLNPDQKLGRLLS
tara:strand:+ start:66 stop:173 length:108 start_codon:yes stop_codon:yes gene_type:complete